MGVKPEKLIEGEKKPLYNKNLVSLKCVLFIFFGGLGCLYPFLPLHMVATGLNYEESRIISIIAPLISVIGPLTVGIWADKLASRKGPQTGKYLRVLIAVCMLGAALFYAILLAVPTLQRWEARRPQVSFACDEDGAMIFQERCTDEKTCYHWKKEKAGSLLLTNCSYTCQTPSKFENLYKPWLDGSPSPPVEETMASLLAEPSTASRSGKGATTPSAESISVEDYLDDSESPAGKTRFNANVQDKLNQPPHICQTAEDSSETTTCHVYTRDAHVITINAKLRGATNQENETHSAEWCRYPLDGFMCHIPPRQAKYMADQRTTNISKCIPNVECEVYEPYDSPNSILADSQCVKMIGDADTTFWTYLIIRCIADSFPTAAIALLDAAIIIATRETSRGRGDYGRQLAWGSLGWAIFAPIVGAIGQAPDTPVYLISIVVSVVLMVVAAVIILLANAMPLSPPEWWWHTKIGMVAIPMSAIRKYGPETGALLLVTIILGIFWSAIDSYQPWHIIELSGEGITQNDLLVGLTLTIGALPALPILWNAERIVDYCGHSNLLIAAFAVYIVRYTGLAILEQPWWTLLMEALEPVTLGLSWAAIVMYMRHLMPRRLTALGQALPVIAHFCLGKSFGALLGLVKSGNTLQSLQCVYRSMAIAAAIVSIVYFALYHCLLAPRCAAKGQPPPSLREGPNPDSPPTNGNRTDAGAPQNGNSYTPLRVYHEERAKKGQFRY